jgi:hypothetical protein
MFEIENPRCHGYIDLFQLPINYAAGWLFSRKYVATLLPYLDLGSFAYSVTVNILVKLLLGEVIIF